MPRSQKAMTIGAAVVVIGVILAGTAAATSTYIVSRLSQLAPSVRGALTTYGTVVDGGVNVVATDTRVVGFSLAHAPAAMTASVLLTNSGSSDAHVTCSLKLGSVQFAAASATVLVPAASMGVPGVGGGSSANTVTVPLAAATKTGGVVGLFCTDSDKTGKVSAAATIQSISVTAASHVVQTPAPTSSSSASASSSASSSTSPSSTASATSTSTSTSSASPSSSSSSSGFCIPNVNC